MPKTLTLAFVAMCLVLAACSSGTSTGVASLSDAVDLERPSEIEDTEPTSDEDALLEFASCMRENGIEDFEDPQINADGSIEFRAPAGDAGTIDRELLTVARDACSQHLEGLSIGPGNIDRSEIEDLFVEFASCMRENGYDMPDPDFSGEPRQGGGPFTEIDPNDPAFQSAMEACEEIFAGSLRLPAQGGGRRG